MFTEWMLIFVLADRLLESSQQCTFPAFLREPLTDNTERTWITETQFIDNTDLWETQLEISVMDTEIVAKLKYKAQCHDYSGNIPCFQREVHYRRSCWREEADGKYLVEHRDNGRTYFTCMRFVPHNKNVVQVWSARPSEELSTSLCHAELEREEWPWLAPTMQEWSYCPIIGGFDFRTYMYERRQKLCHKVWRPSRMESECIRGEGLDFMFPEKSCSPFQDHRQSLHLQCWANWTEDEFMFVVASEPGKIPQYVLRFPRQLQMAPEFDVDVYFSPICPIDRHGFPLGNRDIRRVEMKMRMSEPGICFDESTSSCDRFATQGKCTNSALHQYANFCKRSCGLCNLLPSTRPECRFPTDYRNTWYLFERDRQETLHIQGGNLAFTNLGEYICKSKHWSINNYKLLSYYQNGCRPRYTCLHFQHDDPHVLQFQISKSARSDQSFRLCKFEDDPHPLGDLVRSKNLKTLLPADLTQNHSCGLIGVARVDATLPGGLHCSGTLSDWDSHVCAANDRLVLSLPRCGKGNFIREYQCVAYVNMQDGLSFLMTRPMEGGNISCWIVRTYAERMSYKPWQRAHQLYRAQCGTNEDMDPVVGHVAQLSVYMAQDRVSKPCHTQQEGEHKSTPKPVIAKEIRATQTENGQSKSSVQSVYSLNIGRVCTAVLVCLSLTYLQGS